MSSEPCQERLRLLDALLDATREHAKLSVAMVNLSRTHDPAEFPDSQLAVKQAQYLMDRARSALRIHETEHGCNPILKLPG